LLRLNRMEHNHNPLIYGFLISFFMFGVGIFLAFTGNPIDEIQNKLFVYGVAIMVLVAGTIMLKGVFKTRDECPICKDRFQWNRKK